MQPMSLRLWLRRRCQCLRSGPLPNILVAMVRRWTFAGRRESVCLCNSTSTAGTATSTGALTRWTNFLALLKQRAMPTPDFGERAASASLSEDIHKQHQYENDNCQNCGNARSV